MKMKGYKKTSGKKGGSMGGGTVGNVSVKRKTGGTKPPGKKKTKMSTC